MITLQERCFDCYCTCSDKYTIPMFSVMTVELRHATTQDLDGEGGQHKQADVSFQEHPMPI